MKTRLHSAHFGYDSMMRRARGTICWPGMVTEVKLMVEHCETCEERKSRNQREPLKQHDEGNIPWNKIGVDLFEINGRHYLVPIDYYSNFIAKVVNVLMKQFA